MSKQVNSKTYLTLSVLLAAVFCASASARIIYVDADATGSNNGSNWYSSYQCLQDALAEATAGDEIRVAQGVYKPDQGSSVSSGSRAASFQLKNGVTLKGGYAGNGAAISDYRNIQVYQSVLSGDLAGNDDYVSDPRNLQNEPTRAENSFHVVRANDVDETAVLDGFIIEAGNANRAQALHNQGAGILIQDAHPTVTNCTFRNNSASSSGGGMSNFQYGYPTVTNCIFIYNWADMGAGMYNYWASTPKLTNCVFRNNSANSGGAMYNYLDYAWVINCTFRWNSATNNGGGIYCKDCHTVIINCILWDNTDLGGSDESSQIHIASGSKPSLYYSCVEGWTGTLGDSTNIGANPKFEHPEGQLSAGSPCIDAGRNSIVPAGITTDLAGNDRFVDDPAKPDTGEGTAPIVDMGAYEFPGTPSLPRVIYVIYVDADASGADSGTSWTDAYINLREALYNAANGDEVRVAQGVYPPTDWRWVAVGPAATFQLKDGVAVKGGYAGYGASNPDARDIQAYETILSGDISEAGGIDYCYHVVTAEECYGTTILDGFTITSGYADGDELYSVGGGMYIDGGGPKVTNCTFIDNFAYKHGGGLFIWNSSAEVSNCTFKGNSTSWQFGGGMYTENSWLIVTGCTFSGNSAGWGGGMSNRQSNGTEIVTDCIFSNNSARSGGGMYNDKCLNLYVSNCTFNNNFAGDSESCGGGGMLNHDCIPESIKVINCIFNSNVSSGWQGGGGMCNTYLASPYLINCVFRYNSATGPMEGGGGMNNRLQSCPRIINCTFKNNSASQHGGGICNTPPSGGFLDCSIPSLLNCILWDNSDTGGSDESAQIYNECNDNPTVNHSCIKGWTGTLGGTGNFGSNPRFLDADGRLSASSPCIDAGDNSVVRVGVTTDLDGNPRFINDIVDMGAYEFGGTATSAPPAPTVLTGVGGPNTGEIILTWNPSPRATGYKIFYDEDTSNPPFDPTQNGSPASGSDVGNVTQVTISGLSPGQTYCFAVKAYNAAGESDYSAQVCTIRATPKSSVVCNYSPGDRVVLLVDNPREATNLPAGTCGTVLCTDSADPELPILVSWDGWSGGYNRDQYCDYPPPCYPNNSAYWMACDQIAPGCTQGYFNQCGVLVHVGDCVFFDADGGGRYLLFDYYDFEVGDRVRVRGLLISPCLTFVCGPPNGCIDHPIVSYCDETFCCSPSYSPGDRVRLLVSYPRGAVGLVAGKLGTVICCDYDDPELPVFVSWDSWTNGRNSDIYCDSAIWSYPADSGWWMACDEITSVILMDQ